LTAFHQRDLSQVDYVYLWADGIHFNIRLEQDRLCCLVLIGVRADGHKELVAVSDRYRESTESWSKLLRDLKRRGMTRAGIGHRRWRTWLGRRTRCVSRQPRTTLLGAQRDQGHRAPGTKKGGEASGLKIDAKLLFASRCKSGPGKRQGAR
jgi:hypothetical protein